MLRKLVRGWAQNQMSSVQKGSLKKRNSITIGQEIEKISSHSYLCFHYAPPQ